MIWSTRFAAESNRSLSMVQIFDWLPDQTFEPRRYQTGNIGNWSGHLPFAHDLVLASRPSLLVEVGTHPAESYFGFCQTIAEHNLPCTAYAVGTWEGQRHAEDSEEAVYQEVDSYNKANYQHFSYLLRMQFDNALNSFSSDSIDVLHIDGLHDFDDVVHHFYSWLPKVKPGGIVLLHNIAVRHGTVGVWKLWEKLTEESECFDFHHSGGLGVFRKPGAPDADSEFLRMLFKADQGTKGKLRRWYELLALELERKHERTDGAGELALPGRTAEMQGTITRLTQQLGEAAKRLAAFEAEHETLIDDINRQQTRIYLLEDIREQAKKDREELEDLQNKDLDVERTKKQLAELEEQYAVVSAEHHRLETMLNGILQSRSWKITSPIRRMTESLSGK